MSTEQKPQIDLPVTAVCCSAHGEVFRLQWPSGYLGFALTLTKAAIETSAELREATGGDANRLNAVIAEFGPLCRLVTAEHRLEGYTKGAETSEGWAEHRVCRQCRKFAKGAYGLYVIRRGQAPTEVFFCFKCVARRECAMGEPT